MLSDSVFDCLEAMWEAIITYEYFDNEEYREQLIETLTEMQYLLHKLDAFGRPVQTREYIKKFINEEWDRRINHLCGDES